MEKAGRMKCGVGGEELTEEEGVVDVDAVGEYSGEYEREGAVSERVLDVDCWRRRKGRVREGRR